MNSSTLLILAATALIPIFIAVIYIWSAFNSLVRLNVRVEEAWSGITVQLRRRRDLIPNLVESVKGYAFHEASVLQAAAIDSELTARTTKPEEMTASESAVQRAMMQVFAIAQAYPALMASQNFLDLQDELVNTEDKIQAARRFYNGSVRELNTKMGMFPHVLFARRLGFTAKEFFEEERLDAITELPPVHF